MSFIRLLFKTILSYQIDKGAMTKLNRQRAMLFNLALTVQSIYFLANSIRHFLLHDYYKSMAVLVLSIVLILLFLNKKLGRNVKEKIVFYGLSLFILCFLCLGNGPADAIFAYLALLIFGAFFLKGKHFLGFLGTIVLLYSFTFFALNYSVSYNYLGALPFMVMAIIINYFLKQAEQNELIIQGQLVELQTLDELKSRLFSNVSHEIRTPLTLILGANEKSAPSQYTTIIETNALRLLELTNQILELSKIESKQRKIQLSAVVLDAFVKETVLGFENLAQAKGIDFKVGALPNEKLVYLDKDAVYKMVTNLLLNAFKFSQKNDQVELTLQSNQEGYLVIQVKDTGRGISVEDQKYIFNQFYHSKVGLEASYGIGLALVKEMVLSLGGEIFVESQINKGSVFTIKIPCALDLFNQLERTYELVEALEPVAKMPEVTLWETAVVTDSSAEKPIVLLVEDNEDISQFVTTCLQSDFTVLNAVHGEEGLELAGQYIPDIIISDVMMPIMDGFTLLQSLKSNEKTSHIPVVLLTAKAEQSDKIKGLALEADDYLTKPFSVEELILKIKNRLKAIETIQKKNSKPEIQLVAEEKLNKEDVFLTKIQLLVYKKLSDTNFGADELAQTIGLSKSQLLRKIKALTGVSSANYIRNIRLEYAKQKLINKEGNITEIAFETGFSTQNYFSKCFKEYYGESPKEFLDKM